MAETRSSDALHTGLRCSLGIILLLVLVALAGCGVSTSDGTATTTKPAAAAETVPASYFGMIVRNSGSAPSVAYGSQRLCEDAVSWSSLEPQRGVFDFRALDADVDAAQAHGVSLLLALGQTPSWASSPSGLASQQGESRAAPPVQDSDWDAYVQAVVTRYKGRIAAYEIWSAPDSALQWTGSVEQLVELGNRAYRIIKTTDPSAIVVSPSGDEAWLESYLAVGGGASIDVVGTHLDGGAGAPESQLSALFSLRNAMKKYGADEKPIWDTQQGASFGTSASGEDAAAYVARSVILNWPSGVHRVYWYSWDVRDANSLALTDADSRPTAAAIAYQQVENWLGGATVNGCSSDASSTWTCELVRDGRTTWIVWNPDATMQHSTLGAATATDLSGNQQSLDGLSSITVGRDPLLLQ